ncbi:SIMPL domain-containing protein, partial [Muribaculum intestinale]|uniref:SIMPL domain-containing protein n=2 Tax=Muribaculaceae TaxID=2005473 RepID=UPI0025B4CBB8
IERISDRLDRKGIVCFNITKIDNSDMGHYNRQGLKAALDAARQKAEFIAKNEGLKLLMPYEIVETANEPSMYSAFSNVAYDGGSGMENMRRIVRRYSVKVRYLFQ